jgi:hypothetical protein
MRRLRLYLLAGIAGIIAGRVLGDTGSTPCPGSPPGCPLGYYGKVGSEFWYCCKDSSQTQCVNYWRQKWICNYSDPEDPATFGYTVRATTDTVNLNCDWLIHGNCF